VNPIAQKARVGQSHDGRTHGDKVMPESASGSM
jgi:hypothetical protein